MISQGNAPDKLFYDDPYEAITTGIVSSGKTLKEIASIIYPGSTPDTAKTKLSRALSPENSDVRLNLEMLLAILDRTTPEYFLHFLHDRYGYKRTEKIRDLTPEERLKMIEDRIKERGLDVLFKDVL